MKGMGILDHFHGILCHDHWKPYFQFDCVHSLCNAHHLRELERASEQDGQTWAKKMQELLLEIDDATKKAGGCLSDQIADQYRNQYRSILNQGELESPERARTAQDGKRGRLAKTKARNLLERLLKFENETLRFMTDPVVPFTNNQSESDSKSMPNHSQWRRATPSPGWQLFATLAGVF